MVDHSPDPPHVPWELLSREPVFDLPEIIWDEDSFNAEVAADFHEIAASGTVYDRQTVQGIVLDRLAGLRPTSLDGGYRIEDAEVRLLGTDVAQVLYTLHGQGRVTRRSTLYRRRGTRWQVVFHQGTVVQGAAPLPPDHPAPGGAR